MKNITHNSNKKTIGIVYDVAKKLHQPKHFNLPKDAISEWESEETIELICQTWIELDFHIIRFPIDTSFLNNWANFISECDVIHSLVEGFGSLARESWIASLCEISGVPCIGSSPFVHAICMNKYYIKLLCKTLNIPTADSFCVHTMDDFKNIPEKFFSETHFIKPNAEGSGMGVTESFSISSNKTKTFEVTKNLLELYPDGVLIETYLSGAEYTTGIIGQDEKFLPIAQIEVPDGVYGAENKSKDYLSEKVTFPELSSDVKKTLEDGSRKLFSSLKMFDMVRFDWKCNSVGEPCFLEANTLPGLSKIYSTLPIMAAEAGIDYNMFFRLLFESAYRRRHDRSLWYGQSRVQGLNYSVDLPLQ